MATEKKEFKTEVQQLLDLVIHSLYSNKDIFLRELISNGSDAIDKLRFNALSDKELIKDDSEFRIKLYTDNEARTLTIEDNGIGMTRDARLPMALKGGGLLVRHNDAVELLAAHRPRKARLGL